MKKEKKITFSEEIDNSINEFALVITFLIIGVFLLFNKDYFGNEIVSRVIQWIFIVVGCLGFATEISKLNSERGIKGIDNLIIGIILMIMWAGIYYFIKNWIGNVIGFLFLIMGLYGGSVGILEIVYSIIKIFKDNKYNHKNNLAAFKEIILMLSEIAGIGLIIVQILQAIKII